MSCPGKKGVFVGELTQITCPAKYSSLFTPLSLDLTYVHGVEYTRFREISWSTSQIDRSTLFGETREQSQVSRGGKRCHTKCRNRKPRWRLGKETMMPPARRVISQKLVGHASSSWTQPWNCSLSVALRPPPPSSLLSERASPMA